MGKRINLGIVFDYNEDWIGGTYYFQYLIQSLNLLDDSKKPLITIISNNSNSFNAVKTLGYPYIKYKSLVHSKTRLQRIKDSIIYKLFPSKKIEPIKIDFGIDVLFRPSEIIIPNKIKKHLFWIPDFQEVHLPHLFSKEYLAYRKKTQEALLFKDKNILFSSNDAFNDFKTLYPNAESNCFVVPFSVFHPDFSSINIDDLMVKYGVEKNVPYFFSPNQFWKHKNHFVVLKAAKILKDKNINVRILFSGKESDSRNPTYFYELQEYVKENNLEHNVSFLGFIDRKEQLCLMKHAKAIIQPSLFEGWSSVVEDAKSLNKNLIVSSLKVHEEQLKEKATYFDPYNENDLADKMSFFLTNEVKEPNFDYEKDLNHFGLNFINVISKIYYDQP